MILPPRPDSSIVLPTHCATMNADLRLTFNTFMNSSSEMSSAGFPEPMPALLTRISIAPFILMT